MDDTPSKVGTMFRNYRSKYHRSSAGPRDAVMQVVGYARRQEAVRWLNDQAKNSLPPFRRQQNAKHGFRRKPSMQKSGPIHASVFNHVNLGAAFPKEVILS